MKLSIIIVNYNVRYYLEQCLYSLRKATEGIDSEVFVADNHSHDGSPEFIASQFPEVHLIESNHNLGFARANNTAIRQAAGEYILLLNPDTFVGENTIRRSVEFMDAHPAAGGLGVKMYNSDGKIAKESRRGLPTPMVSLLKMLGFSKKYYMSHLPWDEPAEIEVVSGAYCLLRRKALDEIGLLDETFFMYGEDIDLSYRLLKAKWENWYLPEPILHYKGESTQKSSFRYVHVFYQAMLIFFRKHYGHMRLLLALPIKAAIYLRAFIALIHMTFERIRKSLGFFDVSDDDTFYIFLGSRQMLDECQSIANRRGLAGIFVQEMPEELSNHPCIVYDTATYAYESILSIASTKDASIGTYTPKNKTIITLQEIIK